MWAKYSWAWGPAWGEVDRPSSPTLNKMGFPFSSRYHLQMASCLGVGFWVHAPFFMPGFSLLWISAWCHRFCEFICAPGLLSDRHSFHSYLGAIHHLWLLECFHLPVDVWPLRERVRHPIYGWASIVFHSLYIVQMWVSMLVPIYVKKLLWQELWSIGFDL